MRNGTIVRIDKPDNSEAAKREEAVLQFWRENKIFQKSLKQTEGEKGSPIGLRPREFVFYDGPATANAFPPLHSLVPRVFKDAIPRYKTMRGYHVRRKVGWDTHGLPVELQIEKKLGLKSKKEIEEYGIAKFNKECKDSVWEFIGAWNKFTERSGYWIDYENPYVTYHNDYIESVWNVIKKVDDQKLLYKDYKVVPWCPRCGTALSSHELAQGYEDVKDLSVYVKFKVIGYTDGRFSQSSGRRNATLAGSLSASGDAALPLEPSLCETPHKTSISAFLLAWTTTPWTLPGNVALAVGENVDYVKIKIGDEIFILAKGRLSIITEPYKIIEEFKGKDLIGLEYEPLFPFLTDAISGTEKLKLEKAFKVYGADFVNTVDGTGIVHTAVMYGQDDFVLGTQVGLPKHHLVGLDGKFLAGTGFLKGRFVKEVDTNGKPTLAVDIVEDLKKRDLFFKKENYEHSYPHCWRCHTPLIYYARDSWYIKMSDPKIKKKLISENKKINWEPEYIREGRFGEWLKDVKDWAISRERYWGTPLPVWQCESCKKIEVIGSIEDLKAKTKKSGNRYFVMRHGEAENNVLHIASSNKNFQHHLTEDGKRQIKNALEEIKNTKFDFIFSSPLFRTTETAEIIKNELKINIPIIIDDRITEFNAGEFDGKSINDWNSFFPNRLEEFVIRPKNGENLDDVKKRVAEFLYELESKYQNKDILIISHGDPIWMMYAINEGMTPAEALEFCKNNYYKNGEIKQFNFSPLPRNEDYELDLHKPYIDEISLICKCGGNLIRTKEVMDVWFDSGCMPFAQDHYPFSARGGSAFGGEKIQYPADFICEAIDQTRGWFYTLHAVGVLMGRGKAYKNVICLGHLLDASGKKMSKSLGNVVDPWVMMDKYGVDTLRLWMYSVNQPGESKNFDEKTVTLLHQQVFGLLYNVLAFYELYRDRNLEILQGRSLKKFPQGPSFRKNVLDQWILTRLDELIKLSTENLDNYKLLEPTRAIRDFIGDLSTWYLRRSRERLKDGDEKARQTLYFVLKTLAKILAPLAPFTAEDIWLRLKNEEDAESVHLTEWPKIQNLTPWPLSLLRRGLPANWQAGGGERSSVLKNMQKVREIVTLGLEARQKAGIKVRQPLASLKLKVESEKLSSEYISLIKEELNVKEIILEPRISNLETNVELDIEITPELKAEGDYREFMRELQDERKKMGLNPGDKMPLSIEKIYKKYRIIPNLQEHMLRVAAVASLICDNFNEPLNKKEIITACLLHDMGNIIKSKLEYFPQFLEPEGLEYWQKVKNEYIKKYGDSEHEATINILRELGLSDQIVRLVDRIKFSLLCDQRDSNDLSTKIIHYSDGRVDPHGVVSFEERMDEAKKRYKLKTKDEENERERLVLCGKEIEKQIFAKCRIKPKDINDATIAPIILSLKDFVIH